MSERSQSAPNPNDLQNKKASQKPGSDQRQNANLGQKDAERQKKSEAELKQMSKPQSG